MAHTDDEFERASQRGAVRRAKQVLAKAARYDRTSGKIVIELSNHIEIAFPAAAAQGLKGASAADLAKIEITGAGTGIHFPRLDADLYVPALLEGMLGSRRWMAAQLGAKGGSATSIEKQQAARANGKLGGRPKKQRV
ncbi:MAG TPA: DUF2442 domain-containing protein [Terricaulis sp.]|nr:DUF2442 domain-containing protein [Terricaulis sp.]